MAADTSIPPTYATVGGQLAPFSHSSLLTGLFYKLFSFSLYLIHLLKYRTQNFSDLAPLFYSLLAPLIYLFLFIKVHYDFSSSTFIMNCSTVCGLFYAPGTFQSRHKTMAWV